jgi:hypothetical protein
LRLLIYFCALVLAAGFPQPAMTAWNRASTKHFIIYSEQGPKDLADYAQRLEKFDAAVRLVRRMPDHNVGDGNRLTLFVVADAAAVRKIAGDKSNFLAGFYKGRVEGSIAFAPRPKRSSDGDLDGNTVLFHEYAHHLLAQDIDTPYPQWLVEGFAELLSTARFNRDGSVELGIAPMHRGYGLFELKAVSWPALFAGMNEKMTNEQRETFYGRSWLLTHYLTFERSRKGQIEAYLAAMAKGAEPSAAAASAFGDVTLLAQELDKYLKRSRLPSLKVSGATVPAKPVEIVPLSPGASAMLPQRMLLKNGLSKEALPVVLTQVRAIAQKYPGDQLVETTLAEAELEAGNHALAEAAADRTLAGAPRDVEALLLKGRAIVERLSASDKATPADFVKARQLFASANKIDTEDPEPLFLFYTSYLRAGVRPDANAIAALHYASNLAPQDFGLRINSALQYLRDGKPKDARRTLAVVAFDPHTGEAGAAARRIIGRIDAGDIKGAERAGFAD